MQSGDLLFSCDVYKNAGIRVLLGGARRASPRSKNLKRENPVFFRRGGKTGFHHKKAERGTGQCVG